jgi:hypothetical protein
MFPDDSPSTSTILINLENSHSVEQDLIETRLIAFCLRCITSLKDDMIQLFAVCPFLDNGEVWQSIR